jgi:FAD/FMN-containing dehydrogenase
VIDLSRMRGIRVHPDEKTVRVGAGCVWGDVDHATHAFGMAAPCGFISTTGVAGLTLGGGIGYLTRKYGLTIDNLGAYLNFMMDDGQERVQAGYRDNYQRLAAIKKKYDPDNFFRVIRTFGLLHN